MLTPPRPNQLDPKQTFDRYHFNQWGANNSLAYMPVHHWGDITALSLNIIKYHPAVYKSQDAHLLLTHALSNISTNCVDRRLRAYTKDLNMYFNTAAIKRRFKVVFIHKRAVAHLQEKIDNQLELATLKATLLTARKASRKFDNAL